MNIQDRYYDPNSHCPGCSKVHGCLVIIVGHYCPEEYSRLSAATNEVVASEISSQSKLAFSSSGISTDRATFKERYDYWKLYLESQ
ncbi:MAG: hypothetical protein [Circular genetic element sp.]|nr:MAG: hypothetical protein [Circular genetic element sp.]